MECTDEYDDIGLPNAHQHQQGKTSIDVTRIKRQYENWVQNEMMASFGTRAITAATLSADARNPAFRFHLEK
ncbi:hypothetical protein KIN20_026101 [Parelaphostrongylus tenuis]|uniref:Uncharacterized protein n=1 Tax=Parelaphostrongylus tenuis TaxID=148309 RepID=A0AAD5N9I2_PARTN|nr:hypothetical protein KIN20_026101 [Parelaphostrongylus tenuis]